jgi:hypothetical protein
MSVMDVYALTTDAAGAANKGKDVNNSGTVAEIPAATISTESDKIFKKIGEKLCGSIGEIVENKQSMIIDNINETIKKHLESDSVKDVISKKLEDILNNIPNKEELIKNVNELIKATVNAEIEKTLTNPDTFNHRE